MISITQIDEVMAAPKKTLEDVMSVGGVQIEKGETLALMGTCLSDSRGNTYQYQVLQRIGAGDELHVIEDHSQDRDKHTGPYPQWCRLFGEAKQSTWVLVDYVRGDLEVGTQQVKDKAGEYTKHTRFFHPMGGGQYDYKFEVCASPNGKLPPYAVEKG